MNKWIILGIILFGLISGCTKNIEKEKLIDEYIYKTYPNATDLRITIEYPIFHPKGEFNYNGKSYVIWFDDSTGYVSSVDISEGEMGKWK